MTFAAGAWKSKHYPGKPGKFPGHTDIWQDCAMSMWVGLDGFGNNDLVQCGTESDFRADQTIWEDGTDSGVTSLATHYAWTEFLPQQAVSHVVTSFPVRAGDNLFVQAWVGDPFVDPSGTGFFGNFFFHNNVTGLETTVRTPRAGTIVGGSEAVWIIERPSFSGALKSLSNYGSADMSNANARLGSVMVPFTGPPTLPGVPDAHVLVAVSMVDAAGVTLSTAAVKTADSMTFTWLAP